MKSWAKNGWRMDKWARVKVEKWTNEQKNYYGRKKWVVKKWKMKGEMSSKGMIIKGEARKEWGLKNEVGNRNRNDEWKIKYGGIRKWGMLDCEWNMSDEVIRSEERAMKEREVTILASKEYLKGRNDLWINER